MNNLKEIQKFLDENLLTKQEAMKVTGQTTTSFNQSIATGRLKPFYDHGKGTGRVRLYLRSDVEAYAKDAKERRKRLEKNQ